MIAFTTLETLMSRITTAIDVPGNEDFISDARNSFEELRHTYNQDVVTYCVDQYVNAELDFKSSGDRGLGRMTAFVPRLAAHHRKKVAKLGGSEVSALRLAVQDIVLSGYLACAVAANPNRPVSVTARAVYEEWIPRIYSGNPSDMPSNLSSIVWGFANSPVDDLGKLLRSQGMFTTPEPDEKTQLIIAYYPIAGFWLRVSELRIGGQE